MTPHAKIHDCDQFFVFDAPPFFCAIDGAPIGPSYNPGHAHSDNFTYDLFIHGERFAVDAGTFSYDTNPERVASRSTAAHNTVMINGLEQSEAWGSFRVARRSNPTLARAGRCGEHLVFQGKYANQTDPRQGITHERIIVIKPLRWMLVWDTIEACGAIKAESYSHFAPGWEVAETSEKYRVAHARHGAVTCYPIRVANVSVLKSRYAPEFGKSMNTQTLKFLATGQRRLETGYLFAIENVPGESIEVKRMTDSINIRINQMEQKIDLGDLAL